jgi:hypothetical protein
VRHPQLEMWEGATHKTIDVSRDQQIEAAWKVEVKQEVRVRRPPTSRVRRSKILIRVRIVAPAKD